MSLAVVSSIFPLLHLLASVLHQSVELGTNHKKGAHRCLISNHDQSPISSTIKVITRIFWRRKPILAAYTSVCGIPSLIGVWILAWSSSSMERRGKGRLFVYEHQVFSSADGSQRSSISHQAECLETTWAGEGAWLSVIIDVDLPKLFAI